MATRQHNLTDYEATVRDFRLEVPERFNFARDVLDFWARDRADAPALWWCDEAAHQRTFSFTQLSSRAKSPARAMASISFQRGSSAKVKATKPNRPRNERSLFMPESPLRGRLDGRHLPQWRIESKCQLSHAIKGELRTCGAGELIRAGLREEHGGPRVA